MDDFILASESRQCFEYHTEGNTLKSLTLTLFSKLFN